MKIGILARTFPRPSFEETLDAIAERGITHVQFNMSCADLPTLPERVDEDLCVWIARSFRERGLTMAAISGTFNLCDPDASRLSQDLERLGVLASACRWLDTRIITLCTGTRDPEDMWRWHPENVRRSAWDTLVAATRSAVRFADRHEVTLAFEPERNNVVNSVARARMLLDEVGSPWLKVVLDPANLMTDADGPRLPEILDEALDWLGPDIVLAHAKDPPYVHAGDDLAAIRGYFERNDPRMVLTEIATRRVAARMKEEGMKLSDRLEAMLSEPVPPTLVGLVEFYGTFLDALESRGCDVPVIMHGSGEAEVDVVHAILTGLDRPASGGG